ncbi:OmpA family protein [Vogesella sp. XCS3]|uniref:OmpA family protein n=1 Tax=Vogesella sp. XCS3 TaxID=2877939 RepID=UPI001D0A3EEE|nr:OmpA family protein [Vogesella sp. XCS3]UDM18239.1 OmpA family protein [Vogesella sp. XCS3]
MKTTLCLLLATLLAAPLAEAQTPPDADALIRQLKPATTRGLRNLNIQAAPAAPAAAPAVLASPAAPSVAPGVTAATPQAAAPATPAQPDSAALPAPAPVAATPAANPAVEAAPAAPSVSLAIQFEYNSASVSQVSYQTLQQLSRALQSPELLDYRFRIEGHTDAKGQAAYNRKLSQSRADEVRRVLMTLGVAGERLSSIGLGASQLALPSQPYAAENRRVRIVNLAP